MYKLRCPECGEEIPSGYDLDCKLQCPHCGYSIYDEDSISIEISELERLEKVERDNTGA